MLRLRPGDIVVLLSLTGVVIFFALTLLSQLLLRHWHESAQQQQA